MRFPKIIQNQKTKIEVTIYGKSKGGQRKKGGGVTEPYPFYRLCWRVAGQRRMKSFGTYSKAKKAADDLVRDLGSGSQVTALTPGQARDALAALERLQGFFQATGRKVSLLTGISEYCESVSRLNGHTLSQAVGGFLSSVATVKRVDLGQAVEEFIKGRAHKIKSENGKRPQLSASYAYIVAMWLREFAKTFPGTAVCDLTKELLNAYMASHSGVTARTRNGRRSVLGMFLKWCVRQDYLAAGHRLLEADGMAHEESEPEAIEFYTPAQLSGLLQTASEQTERRHLLPVIALCGLAGLRLQESVRLTWEGVFRVEGHVEISRTKSKTRARRLVNTCPRPGAMARALPQLHRPNLDQRPGKVSFGFRRLAQVAEDPGAPEWIASRLLHLPLRPALQREPDRRAGRQLAHDDSRALQRAGHESGGREMVQRAPHQRRGECCSVPQTSPRMNTSSTLHIREWQKSETVFELHSWRPQEGLMLFQMPRESGR